MKRCASVAYAIASVRLRHGPAGSSALLLCHDRNSPKTSLPNGQLNSRSTSSRPQTTDELSLRSTSRRRYCSKFVTGLRLGFQVSEGKTFKSSCSAKQSANVSNSFSTDVSES